MKSQTKLVCACTRMVTFASITAECSAPEVIDGVVCMVHGNGAQKNLHRPRHIEGVCEKVAKGQPRSQGLSSLPPLVVGRKTLLRLVTC